MGKRAYIFEPDPKWELDRSADQTFWIIDGLPVWDLGDGFFQVICEAGKCPEWAIGGVDIAAVDKDPVKKTTLAKCYQPTCEAVAKDEGKGIEAKPARVVPLPRVVLLGMVPEDLVSPTGMVLEDLVKDKEFE